jgi:2-keto-3-deoxy-L-rhamnonate aldolase RhmA
VLDGGALGIIVPHVNTADEARRAVNNCKFPPVGHRSVMGGYAQLDFESVPLGEATRIMNENTILVVMIETPEAVENVDEIAAIDGIDVVHVGTGDLVTEMGLHGQVDHPKVAEAFERVIAACRKHGRFAGMGGIRDQALAERYVGMGFRFLTTNSDLAFLLQAASARVKRMRELKLD